MSSPLPVPIAWDTLSGDLFEVAAHRDCPFHPIFNRFVTVALIVGLLRPVISRYAVPRSPDFPPIPEKPESAMLCSSAGLNCTTLFAVCNENKDSNGFFACNTYPIFHKMIHKREKEVEVGSFYVKNSALFSVFVYVDFCRKCSGCGVFVSVI